jgi:hypothetical protein
MGTQKKNRQGLDEDLPILVSASGCVLRISSVHLRRVGVCCLFLETQALPQCGIRKNYNLGFTQILHAAARIELLIQLLT